MRTRPCHEPGTRDRSSSRYGTRVASGSPARAMMMSSPWTTWARKRANCVLASEICTGGVPPTARRETLVQRVAPAEAASTDAAPQPQGCGERSAVLRPPLGRQACAGQRTARRVAPQGDTAPYHARLPARALELLSKHGTGCASRVCAVADKPRQRRVSVWRVLSLRRPPVQHHRTRAPAQPHVCLRLGVEPAVWAGGCSAHPDFPFRLPLPRALCPHAIPPGDPTPLREELRAGLREWPARHHVMARMLAHALASGNGRGRVQRRRRDFCEFA
jgi:hypothetical protein